LEYLVFQVNMQKGERAKRTSLVITITECEATNPLSLSLSLSLGKGLSSYFAARNVWAKNDYGLAICMLMEAQKSMSTRSSNTSPGIPDIDTRSSLRGIVGDLNDLRAHISQLTTRWKKDNDSIYFAKVPGSVKEEAKLVSGTQMMKVVVYTFDKEIEPVVLGVEESGGGGGGGASAPPPPTAPVGVGEEELAKELRAK